MHRPTPENSRHHDDHHRCGPPEAAGHSGGRNRQDLWNLFDPEQVLSRREFLSRAAAATGVLLLGGALWSLVGCGPEQGGRPESTTSMDSTRLEKRDLTIGFIPIACATPIIMADPLGFYKKYGLNVVVKKFSGWADIRDAFIAGEIDASHMLSPMPIALSLGAGSSRVPTRLAAIENINGQAITLANKHKGIREVKDLKGMTLGIPFEFSMHNLLLRHFLAKGGLDPDRDVKLRVVRPPDMVASLAVGNIDGFLGPEPFNQRAVHEGVGFIYLLSKNIWNNHPCCAFAVKEDFIQRYPNTYQALLRAIADATQYAHEFSHREEIAKAISGRQYLNQPEAVVKAVLTGKFDDGRGNRIDDPARIDFDGYPWRSFAAWIVTQLIRWGYVPPGAGQDVKKVAAEVFRTEDFRKARESLGLATPKEDYKTEVILGDSFDVDAAQKWMQRAIAL